MNDSDRISRRAAALVLLVLLAAAVSIRFCRMDEPFGGYHALNEAWYASQARNFQHTSFLNPTVSEGLVDYKVRPLYPYLAYLVSRAIGGDYVFGPRLVSVLFSFAGIIFMYLIGARLAGRGTGLAAAAILSTTPIYIMLGRQAQPDAAYITLTLAALWLYLISKNSPKEIALKAAAGLVWGTAVFTKNFAVFLLPGIILAELFESKSTGVLNRRFLWFILIAILVPLPFVVYHHIAHPGALWDIYSRSAIRAPNAEAISYMAKEIFWAASPAVFVAATAGAALFTLKKQKAGIWSLCLALPFLAQYFFIHSHSYYLLGAVSFMALAAALPFSTGQHRSARTAVLVIVLIAAFVQAAATLASVKWNQKQFVEIVRDIRSRREPAVVVLSKPVSENYRSLFYFYMPDSPVFAQNLLKRDTDDYAMIPSGRRVFMVDFANGPQITTGPYQSVYGYTLLGIAAFGKAFTWIPFNMHSFIPKQIKISRAPGFLNGTAPTGRVPTLIVTEMPDGYRLRYMEGHWLFQPEVR